MATSDLKILESRLLSRDSVVTGSSVTRCAQRMQEVFVALRGQTQSAKENPKEAVLTAMRAFCRELMLYKLEMGKLDQSCAMLDDECAEFDNLESTIMNGIEETMQSIENLSKELVQQKRLKRHRDECEALSRIVNKIPSTAQISVDISRTREDIASLDEQMAAAEAMKQMRGRQVNLLLQAIADLNQSLEEEEALQKQLQALQQAIDSQANDDDDNEDNDDDLDADDGTGDKRSDRSNEKRNKPSMNEYDVGKEEGEEEEDDDESTKKGVKRMRVDMETKDENVASENSSKSNASSGSGSSNAPMSMTEKLLQRHMKKRAQNIMDKQRSKSSKNPVHTETEEGEEEEEEEDNEEMDISAN